MRDAISHNFDNKIENNTFLIFQGHYNRGYEKRFGFSLETYEDKIWPGKEECTILIKNLEKACPGLTRRVTKGGNEVPLPIQKQLLIKIQNDNRHRMLKLRGRPRAKAPVTRPSQPSPSNASILTLSDFKKRKLSDTVTKTETFDDFSSKHSGEGDTSSNFEPVSTSEFFVEEETVEYLLN